MPLPKHSRVFRPLSPLAYLLYVVLLPVHLTKGALSLLGWSPSIALAPQWVVGVSMARPIINLLVKRLDQAAEELQEKIELQSNSISNRKAALEHITVLHALQADYLRRDHPGSDLSEI